MSNQTYTSMYSRNLELYHHGIRGQKWGVRNGPPYPLGSGKGGGKKVTRKTSPNRVEKSENNKSQMSSEKVNSFINKRLSNKAEVNARAKGLPEEVLSQAGFVAALVGASFVGLTAARVRENLTAEMERKSNMKQQQGDFKKKESQEKTSMKSDATKCNPNFQTGRKWNNNCVLASATYEMRRRGYDVTANPSKTGRSTKDMARMFGMKSKEVDKASTYNQLEKSLKSMPDGSRGILLTGVGSLGSRHAVSWEKQGSSLKIIDAQRNKVYQDMAYAKLDGYFNTAMGNYKHEYIRTDDKQIDEKYIKDACVNRT